MLKRPIEFSAILYITIWTISPPLQLGMVPRFAALGCAVLLFVCNRFHLTKENGIALIFVGLIVITTALFVGVSSVLGNIAIYMLFIGYVMNSWHRDDWQDFRMIVPIVLILLTVWNLKTVSALEINPHACREIVRDSAAANAYLRSGVGGYGLVYSQVIVAPALFDWVWKAFRGNKLLFLCGGVWAVSFVRLLADSGYTIALVTTVISLAVLLVYKKEKVTTAMIISILLVLILVYLVGFNAVTRDFLLDVFSGTKVADKIRDISSTVTTDETADSISSRIIRYRADFALMLKYPIVGSWWKGGGGGHSALLGAFAQYGVIGGLLLSKMYYCVPLMWKKKRHKSAMNPIVNATIISITFVCLLDSVPYNLTMMLTAVLPIVFSDIVNWSRKYEHTLDR